ncbi:MAG: hypothetical protein FJ044_05460 [Candidatus Cloacimonetes bacterium]|nr:hypothetical protein [Candidatus Cloacimonadota bacterium]
MIIFRYKTEKGTHQQLVKRPVADVWLKKGKGWLEFHPYIDSGADVTLLPFSLGELLGFKINDEKIEEIGGIKGAVPVIYKIWQIKIGEKIFSILVAWALIEDVPPLLGRADVFDFFNITFRQKEGKIIFERRW